MNRQEEIKEGIARFIAINNGANTYAEDDKKLCNDILTYLHSQGIKLPDGSSLIEVSWKT